GAYESAMHALAAALGGAPRAARRRRRRSHSAAATTNPANPTHSGHDASVPRATAPMAEPARRASAFNGSGVTRAMSRPIALITSGAMNRPPSPGAAEGTPN